MEEFKDGTRKEQRSWIRTEKKRIEELRYNTPPDSVLLYQDEKGPVAAKIHGGQSWCSVHTKIEKAQKIKGLLNVFGVYDHTNEQMYTHSYRNKTGKQFLDFIKCIDIKYDSSSVKQIFLVLDNASIHRSKKVREIIQKHHHQRINLVFLPTRSSELNLIEVRWLWMHRDRL